MEELDDDFIDATGVDYDADPVEDADVDLIVLFPNGKDEELENAYKELFGS